jgi:hypothetical protein
MSGTQQRILTAAIRLLAADHGLPSRAPLAMAEQLAAAALDDGATAGEALDRAAGYLRSWALHPANVVLGRQLRAAG